MTKSILARQPDETIQLTITVPQQDIKKTYEEFLQGFVAEAKIPGFRKGKAPKTLVTDKIDTAKVYEQVIQKIVPQSYLEAIQEHKLEPILSPKIELLKAKENEDWEFRATTCETPKVDLQNYKEEIRKSMATAKLWTPGSTEPTKPEQATEEEKIQKVIQALLQTVKVEIPVILIEDQLNRSLSNLVNQTEKLGLTIDQYLASINKTAEQLREEYKSRIKADLKLQFILDEIARVDKFKVPEKEIEDIINATGSEEVKKDLHSPVQIEYVKRILARRKVLEALSHQ